MAMNHVMIPDRVEQTSQHHSYDSRHDVTHQLAIGYDSYDCQSLLWFQTWFNTPVYIIAMIHMTVNHGYDSSQGFNTPQNIMVMI